MDFKELVHSRRSTRGFANKAISKAVIQEIIEDAKRAPSSMNSQPWHVHVLTGAPLDEVRRRNMEEMAAGKPSKRDIFTHGPYEGAHRQRQVDIAKQLFAAMGIARDDKPMRQDWVMRGFRQFDAPVSLVLTTIASSIPVPPATLIWARCATASCWPPGIAASAPS